MEIEQQIQNYQEAIKLLCAAGEVDPTDVADIQIKPYGVTLTVYKKNDDGKRYLSCKHGAYHLDHNGRCEAATHKIRLPGAPVE